MNPPPGNPELDAQVRGAVYHAFIAKTATPSMAELAASLSISEREVVACCRRLADAHMLVLQPESGEVLMANPFSAVPTAFSVTSGNREWWANCIWDALGVLAMIAADGSIHTSCPDCGQGLSLTISSSHLLQTSHIVHFAVPAARWWDDIVFT